MFNIFNAACRDVHGKLSYTESYEVMKLAGDTSLGETVLTIPARRATTDAADEASVFEGDGFSDEPIDRWCELCFEKTNTKIEASGFCLECYTFLCKPCLDNHSMFPSMQNHRLLQGGRLPKTQADRPVKYLDCDIHRGNVNDQFCMDHSKMVCSQCIAEFHMACKRKLISDLCPDLGSIDIQDLRDIIETIQKNINFAKNNMEQNKDIMTIQKNEMIKEAKQVRDKLISKIENAYSSTLSDINNFYDKKVSHLSNQVFALSDMITSLDQTTLKVEEIIGTDITPDVFIQLQDMVGNVHQSQRELAELEKQLCKVDLSFSTSPEISAFLSLNNPLGSVKEDSSQLDLMTPIPRIAFPSQSRKTNKSTTRDGRIDRDISQIKATKMDLLNLKMADNQRTCDITGMAVTRNNLLLLADWGNEKVKVFSPDNTLLSSLTLYGKPYDITVIDDSTAVVSTTDGKLHILDISDQASLSIQRSVSLGYRASGVAPCNNNLVVIKWTEPRCVKMITMTGAEMWSVSTDNNGQQLFENPYSVTITTINDQLTAIVTDYRKDTIILLDANNGDVIKIVDVKGKRPHGLTVDNDVNVYVCCQRSKEICVWSADFSQSRILLSGSDLQPKVQDIVYSDNTDEILICYVKVDTVDRFELS